MATSRILINDLKAGRCSNRVEMRLLRFWEARNVKKGRELIGVDMVFVDEKSTLIQASVSSHRLEKYKHLFSEGSMYSICGFDVTRSYNHFKISDFHLTIRFNDHTRFVRLNESTNPIPVEIFSFRNHDQLLALANTNTQLPDIVGELTAIKSTFNDDLQGNQRVMVTLKMDGESLICFSLFDGKAFEFHTKYKGYGKDPRVIVATTVNPKFVGGRLFANATSGTHIYFDSETSVGHTYYESLDGNGSEASPTPVKKLHAQKIESLTVSELNEFVISAEPQQIDFLCTGKVTVIKTEKGWCYIGCSKCTKKLLQNETSFTCPVCGNPNAIASLRFRVELSVSDGTEEAVFVAFDREMTKLRNISATEVGKSMGGDFDDQQSKEIPDIVSHIVGNTYTFQLKLKDFDFTPNHETFAISRIFTERQEAPNPEFGVHGVEDVGTNTPTNELNSSASNSGEGGNTNAEDTETPVGILTQVEGIDNGNAKQKTIESAAKKIRTG